MVNQDNSSKSDNFRIEQERPNSADAITLIRELEGVLGPLYPDESRHGYSVEKLLAQGVHFFIGRVQGQAAACGGVQFYGAAYGELKRMYVRPGFRGLGLGRAILVHLEDFTRTHAIPLLRLETGIHQKEAISLYEKFGFYEIPPFGEYNADPLSLFFEKEIGYS